MKKEKELNIFRAPNLDALKSMYYKSKAYITDKISLENETTLIVDAFRQLKDSETTKKTIRYFENELSIFKAPSIEVLKSLYFASTGIVLNKYSWELEVNNIKETFRQYDNIHHAKKSFVRIGKELKIFRKPSVDVLRSLYHKSFGFVFNRDSWGFESPFLSKTLKRLNENHRTKRTMDKIGHELRIFSQPNIENLKILYKNTSNFLEGSQQPTEQPISI